MKPVAAAVTGRLWDLRFVERCRDLAHNVAVVVVVVLLLAASGCDVLSRVAFEELTWLSGWLWRALGVAVSVVLLLDRRRKRINERVEAPASSDRSPGEVVS